MSNQVEVSMETITPEIALKMLERNTRNRNLRKTHIAKLARDMAAGNWIMNGEAIRFNGDGTLLDGQHRLKACVSSGAAFGTLVIRGLPHEAQLTVDTGARRSAGDHMKIAGVKYAHQVAAACRYAMILQEGIYSSQSYTNSEICDFFEQYPEIEDLAPLKDRDIVGTGSISVCGAFVISQVKPEKLGEYIEQWLDGQGDSDSPLIRLRNKIIRSKITGVPFQDKRRIQAFAHALGKFIRGQKTTKVYTPEKWKIPGWTK